MTLRRLLRNDTDASASQTGLSEPSRRLVIAAALRRSRDDDEAVTEVIGYVLSFALSAIFLLLALNVFWAARSNTEDVTTGVEIKTIADRVSSHIVEMGLVSQEFPNATMNVTINIPQSFSGRLYTIEARDQNVVVATNDAALSATSTNFKVDALPNVWVSGSVDSSNQRVVVQYDLLTNSTRHISIRGE